MKRDLVGAVFVNERAKTTVIEGGTWKGVDFDLRGCRHFIFRRVWTEDCRVLVDGAVECVIEYLETAAPTPKQIFEIRPL